MKKPLYRIVSLAIAVLIASSVLAQDEDEKVRAPFWDKVQVGGNLGLNFGTFTYIELAPRVGYRVTDWFVPGVGLSYQYIGNRFEDMSIYSGSVFAQLIPLDMVFGQVELERMALGYKDKFAGDIDRTFFTGSRLLVGGGFRQPLGGNSFAGITILWNVLDDSQPPTNIFPNPIIRAGFMFGL